MEQYIRFLLFRIIQIIFYIYIMYKCNDKCFISCLIRKMFNEGIVYFRRACTRERKVQIHLRRSGPHLHRVDRKELIDNRRSYVSDDCRNDWRLFVHPINAVYYRDHFVKPTNPLTLSLLLLLHLYLKFVGSETNTFRVPSRPIPPFRFLFLFYPVNTLVFELFIAYDLLPSFPFFSSLFIL